MTFYQNMCTTQTAVPAVYTMKPPCIHKHTSQYAMSLTTQQQELHNTTYLTYTCLPKHNSDDGPVMIATIWNQYVWRNTAAFLEYTEPASDILAATLTMQVRI